MTWRTPWEQAATPNIVHRLCQGDDVRTIAARFGCDHDDVRAIAKRAGLELIIRRGRTIARAGAGWYRVLVGGKVYERARLLPDQKISLVTSGRGAGQHIVPWSAVEAFAPILRTGQATAVRPRWTVIHPPANHHAPTR